MPVCIGVLKETSAQEARVALTPDVAAKFVELGATLALQRGAGERSHFGDEAYKGAQLTPGSAEVLGLANVLLKVQPPTLCRDRRACARHRRRRLHAGPS